MFQKTLKKYNELSKEIKSMIFLFWIHDLGLIITTIFLSTFVFIKTQSFLFLIVYYLFVITGGNFGFVVWGYVLSRFQISLRLNYLRSFFIYFCAFLFLLIFPHSNQNLLIFGFIQGLGLGMFWVGMHSFEMVLTRDDKRDFYSSVLTLGSQVITVLSPLLATLTFLVSVKIFQTDAFYVLFWIMPVIYLSALPFLFNLPDFIPPKISKKHLKKLFTDKKYKNIRPFLFLTNSANAINPILTAIISLYVLKNVTNIGIFETVMGIMSVLAVIFLSHKRNPGNRFKIFTYALTGFLIGIGLLFFYETTVLFYILYALIFIFFKPIYRVSQHLLDLEAIEKMRSENTFYEGLLFRDFLIFLGRIFPLLIMAGFYLIFQDNELAIKFSIILYAFFYILLGLSAKYMLKKV